MGFMDFLFGGTKYKQTNDAATQALANRLGGGMFGPGGTPLGDVGIGTAGKLAKGYLKDVKAGRMDQLPSVMMAKAQGARNWTDLQRNIQMSSAMMPGEQSALTTGILSKGMLQNQDNTGANALTGAANDISNFSQIFNLAKSNKDQTNTQRAGLRLQGQHAGADIMQKGMRAFQSPGLIGALGQIGGMLGGLIPGIGQLGGLSKLFGGGMPTRGHGTMQTGYGYLPSGPYG